MFLASRLCAIVCATTLVSYTLAQGQADLAQRIGSSKRQHELSAALSNEDWVMRRRAVQELAEAVQRDELPVNTLFQIANTSWIETEHFDLVKCLRELVQRDKLPSDETIRELDGWPAVLLCCAISGSTSSRSNVTSILKEKAQSKHASTNAVLAARAALANLDIDRSANIGMLRDLLADNSAQTASLLEVMLLARLGPWAADSLTPRIEALLKTQSPISGLAALLAASWGKSGGVILPTLRQAIEKAKNLPGGNAAMIYRFAEAKLSSNGSNWLTADLVKILASETDFDHSMWIAYLFISGSVLHEADLPEIISLLGSQDPDVASASARLCWAVGLSAKRAEPRLLELVRTSASAKVRGSAAQALGALGSQSSVAKLKELASKEGSESVKDAMIQAIRVISLGKSI